MIVGVGVGGARAGASRFARPCPSGRREPHLDAEHIRKFWEPRMRSALLAHVADQGGEGLSPLVIDAIKAHAADLTVAAGRIPGAPIVDSPTGG